MSEERESYLRHRTNIMNTLPGHPEHWGLICGELGKGLKSYRIKLTKESFRSGFKRNAVLRDFEDLRSFYVSSESCKCPFSIDRSLWV